MKENPHIYALTPPAIVTGGIELLHQLVYEFKKHDLNAHIWYSINEKNKDKLPYQPSIYTLRYKTDYVIEFPPEGSIIVLPEVAACYANDVRFKNYPKIIYWESVDNYFPPTPKELCYQFPEENIIHIVQSYYAYQFVLRKCKIPADNILFVTDYLSDDFLSLTSPPGQPLPRVLYNPKKYDKTNFLQSVKEELPDVEFLPLENYTTPELIDVMQNSMLYVDFGNHPGKDRMPREAALCGCCIVTSTEGSAYFQEDVAIPQGYKFYIHDKNNIPAAAAKIRYILSHYDECTNQFNGYRTKIRLEKMQFEQGVTNLITEIKQRGWIK